MTYIQEVNKGKILYIGHSMGTTIFYVFASEKPEIASNTILGAISFSPVVFLGNVASTGLRLASRLVFLAKVKFIFYNLTVHDL